MKVIALLVVGTSALISGSFGKPQFPGKFQSLETFQAFDSNKGIILFMISLADSCRLVVVEQSPKCKKLACRLTMIWLIQGELQLHNKSVSRATESRFIEDLIL